MRLRPLKCNVPLRMPLRRRSDRFCHSFGVALLLPWATCGRFYIYIYCYHMYIYIGCIVKHFAMEPMISSFGVFLNNMILIAIVTILPLCVCLVHKTNNVATPWIYAPIWVDIYIYISIKHIVASCLHIHVYIYIYTWIYVSWSSHGEPFVKLELPGETIFVTASSLIGRKQNWPWPGANGVTLSKHHLRRASMAILSFLCLLFCILYKKQVKTTIVPPR